MLADVAKSVAQLFSREFRGILWISLGLSLAALIVIVSAGTQLLAVYTFFGSEWLESIADISAVIGTIVLAFLLFPAVMPIFMSLFLERAAKTVEARHYPHLPPAREQPIVEILWVGIRLAIIVVLVNLVLLPVYILTIFIAGLGLVIYYLVNGYLFGREYMEMVALRRLDPVAAKAFRRRHRAAAFIAGVIIAAYATVPLLNLTLPLFATAFMVHVFERIQRRA